MQDVYQLFLQAVPPSILRGSRKKYPTFVLSPNEGGKTHLSALQYATAICVRLRRCSLARIELMWLRTVPSPI